MSKEYNKIFILSLMILGISGLPVHHKRHKRHSYSQRPFWHLPCGDPTPDSEINNLNEEEGELSLERIINQHKNALADYLHHDYEFLYERVRLGPAEHQYLPNWLPGKKDVHIVKKLSGKSSQTIINHLPKLHEDLQKFSIAINQMLEDEPTFKVRDALTKTKFYLRLMLCEVESGIVIFEDLSIPERINSDIIAVEERHPTDDTVRLVRDWGVLLKYKNYLHAWKHVFND
ncbi:uncharacterized protein LOC130674365 [Microplitis mediator]|uniref:uncharacterized protein LOC130674365 n=1 Tax=Microplitis mediator TaxID=375433 RepID=UPI002556D509|nr:uncharacterized protein LOC130674365 [Microplitis mediator]